MLSTAPLVLWAGRQAHLTRTARYLYTSSTERTLHQNFADLARMAFHYSARTRLYQENEQGGHPYHQPTKSQVTAGKALRQGDVIAKQGRVQVCEMEEYCGMQLEVWNILHNDSRSLGQRVTRLQGKFFCACSNFVERAFPCRHVSAVAEYESMTARSSEGGQPVKTTLHWALNPQLKVKKRGAPTKFIHRRKFVEGTRVLINRSDGARQIGAVVGNARESCDVNLGKEEALHRVPFRSIVEWLSTDKARMSHNVNADEVGTIIPSPDVQITDSAGKKMKRKRNHVSGKLWKASSPMSDVPEDQRPKAIPWGVELGAVKIEDTCPYDAVFAILMHLLASNASIWAFMQSRKEWDLQFQKLHDIYESFWNGHVAEVSKTLLRR